MEANCPRCPAPVRLHRTSSTARPNTESCLLTQNQCYALTWAHRLADHYDIERTPVQLVGNKQALRGDRVA